MLKNINKIDKDKEIFIYFHIYPDGDTIGSALGLKELLIKNGFKKVYIPELSEETNLETYPFKFYKENVVEEIKNNKNLNFNEMKNRQNFFVDFEPVGRCYHKKTTLEGDLFVIDHHPQLQHEENEKVFNNVVRYIDDKQSSGSEMILRLFDNIETIQEIEPLLKGIMFDTGMLSYSNVLKTDLLLLIHNSLKNFPDFDWGNFRQSLTLLTEEEIFDEMEITNYIFKNRQIIENKRNVNYVFVDKEDVEKEELDFLNKNLSKTIIKLNQLKNDVCIFCYYDKENDVYKGSLRTKNSDAKINFLNNKTNIDGFDFGGHEKSCGFKIDKSIIDSIGVIAFLNELSRVFAFKDEENIKDIKTFLKKQNLNNKTNQM
ncbi:MAG: DHH family phosphoesterase [Mycoplasma sp.]